MAEGDPQVPKPQEFNLTSWEPRRATTGMSPVRHRLRAPNQAVR